MIIIIIIIIITIITIITIIIIIVVVVVVVVVVDRDWQTDASYKFAGVSTPPDIGTKNDNNYINN